MNDTITARVDVLIIGAGLSGVGAGAHLRRRCPDRSFLLLERREAIGGTWDLFRYPGIRSDSDMFTLGYGFRPWQSDRSIADGRSIRDYIVETSDAEDVTSRIRFGRRVDRGGSGRRRTSCGRSPAESVTATNATSAAFVWSCAGYFAYDAGYRPEFRGQTQFTGRILHPQEWPEDFDPTGKRIVVIGSGATAITLVPALVDAGGSVTMVQRSPSYVAAIPAIDGMARMVNRVLPGGAAAAIIRWKNILFNLGIYQLSQRAPRVMKAVLRRSNRKLLPPGYPVDVDFAPRYNPWDQRLCLAPDGDFFAAVRSGRAAVRTSEIDRLDAAGIVLTDGRRLDADIIVTATGLRLQVLGGVRPIVDGRTIELRDTVAYKGMMLSGVPNLALTVGYSNASWTLRADLIAEYVCRLLRHMAVHGARTVTPSLPDAGTALRPLIDLKSGYIRRSLDELPKQGDRRPWRVYQNYLLDRRVMRYGPVTDGVEFG